MPVDHEGEAVPCQEILRVDALAYSILSAVTGSTRVARRAGM